MQYITTIIKGYVWNSRHKCLNAFNLRDVRRTAKPDDVFYVFNNLQTGKQRDGGPNQSLKECSLVPIMNIGHKWSHFVVQGVIDFKNRPADNERGGIFATSPATCHIYGYCRALIRSNT